VELAMTADLYLMIDPVLWKERSTTRNKYRLSAHRLQIRQHLLDMFLSCIPSEFLSDVSPRGSPPTGATRPAHITLTQLFSPDRDAMGNAIDLPAPYT
jgi:hypothetical protein